MYLALAAFVVSALSLVVSFVALLVALDRRVI